MSANRSTRHALLVADRLRVLAGAVAPERSKRGLAYLQPGVVRLLAEWIGGAVEGAERIDCHHNLTEKERHWGVTSG